MNWHVCKDQMGNSLELPKPPHRIISLVPSQTELLFDLGLDEQVVGITKFCIHPSHWRKTKTIIGGTKKFDIDRITRLNPDLIIGNKEENYSEGIQELQKNFPVWMSDITTFDHALSMIASISKMTDRESQGELLLTTIQEGFSRFHPLPPLRTLYLMWRNPWMGVAGKTFIHSMMERVGLVNVLSGRDRYPELSADYIRDLAPGLVLLSSEPFPFDEKHIVEIQTLLPHARVLLVDGEFFSWYGSRLSLAPGYLASLGIGL